MLLIPSLDVWALLTSLFYLCFDFSLFLRCLFRCISLFLKHQTFAVAAWVFHPFLILLCAPFRCWFYKSLNMWFEGLHWSKWWRCMLLCCMVGRCTHGSIARLPMLMLCMLSLFSVDEVRRVAWRLPGWFVWPSERCRCNFYYDWDALYSWWFFIKNSCT